MSDGGPSWKLHTLEKSLKTCHLQVDSHGLQDLYDGGPSIEMRRLARSITKRLQGELGNLPLWRHKLAIFLVLRMKEARLACL